MKSFETKGPCGGCGASRWPCDCPTAEEMSENRHYRRRGRVERDRLERYLPRSVVARVHMFGLQTRDVP
jgi:hypothetical protein